MDKITEEKLSKKLQDILNHYNNTYPEIIREISEINTKILIFNLKYGTNFKLK